METIKYLIIGGGVAGTTAADVARQNDPAGSIAIISDEPYRFYSRIMLSKPNFFLEKIPFEQIWLRQEAWYEKNAVKLLAGMMAKKIDTIKKEVTLNDGLVVRYEKLLLATGTVVRRWEAPGADKKCVYDLRTLDDAKAIIAAVKTTKKAVVIGGGFISFEMCDMLRMAGIDVTLILRESYFWEPLLDEPSGKMIEDALEKHGVKILRSAVVREVTGGEAVEGVVLESGEVLPCEMIAVGIGVFTPVEWLKEAGITVNRGIIANEYLETNIQDVWTAGDCAEFYDVILGERTKLGNWVNAQMQGKTAALNMLGKKTQFSGVSFYTTSGFGMTIAFAGNIRVGEGCEVITRGSRELGWYVRLVASDGRIVGATLINRTQELGTISKIIEKKIDVALRKAEIKDPTFDMKQMVS